MYLMFFRIVEINVELNWIEYTKTHIFSIYIYKHEIWKKIRYNKTNAFIEGLKAVISCYNFFYKSKCISIYAAHTKFPSIVNPKRSKKI